MSSDYSVLGTWERDECQRARGPDLVIGLAGVELAAEQTGKATEEPGRRY